MNTTAEKIKLDLNNANELMKGTEQKLYHRSSVHELEAGKWKYAETV